VPTAYWSVISHGGRIIHDIIHINTYIRVSSQPVRHTCSLHYGHSIDIHVHATVYLYILLSCILFQEISDIPVTETQTDTEMIDISKTHTETNSQQIFNTDTIYI